MKILLLIATLFNFLPAGTQPRHFIYFGSDREDIKTDTAFLHSKNITGAQIRYTWRMLEPQKDQYNFREIEEDLVFLQSQGKQLFVQLSDVTFDQRWIAVPIYLINNAECHGGIGQKYNFKNNDEAYPIKAGSVARRWDPKVRERFQQLLFQLGKQFDGRIAGINLPETAVDFGSGPLHPPGFTYETYRDGILDNMSALKKAFTRSVCIQYANFMPGGYLPGGPHPEYLPSVYAHAKKLGVGVGGPDILVYKKGQMNNSYGLIRESSGSIPTGVAVQDGNYDHINPVTGKQVTIQEIYDFGKTYLGLNYIFWCTEQPYYSRDVIPFINNLSLNK